MSHSRYPGMSRTGSSIHVSNRLFSRVFSWMFVGLSMTAIIAFALSSNPAIPKYLASHPLFFYGVIVLQIIMVLFLSVRIQKMSAFTATFAFFVYAALNGITFTLILSYFNLGTVTTAFLMAAGMFGIAAFIGYVTKMDLSKLGFVAMMALIGIILATVVNIFLQNSLVTLIISYIGVIVFSILTAFDIQKIKHLQATFAGSEEEITKVAIMGALALYLDFINIFFYLLQILRSDD